MRIVRLKTIVSMTAIFCFLGSRVMAEPAPAPNAAAATQAAKAVIIFTEGEVQYKDAGSSEWKPAAKGMPVSQGGEILTSEGGTCHVALGPGLKCVTKVKPGTHAVLRSLEPVEINLQAGKLFSLLRDLPKDSVFKVMTATAVASARGTWEEVGVGDSDGDGSADTTVSNFEDDKGDSESTVVVQDVASGEEQIVEEGEFTSLDDDGFATDEPGDISSEAQEEAGQDAEESEQAAETFEASAGDDNQPAAEAQATDTSTEEVSGTEETDSGEGDAEEADAEETESQDETFESEETDPFEIDFDPSEITSDAQEDNLEEGIAEEFGEEEEEEDVCTVYDDCPDTYCDLYPEDEEHCDA